jgi:hypothetical protein
MPDTIVGGSAASILSNLYDLRDLGLIDAGVAARIEAALESGNSAVIARAVDDLEATEADAAYFGLDADVNVLRTNLAASVGYTIRGPSRAMQEQSQLSPTLRYIRSSQSRSQRLRHRVSRETPRFRSWAAECMSRQKSREPMIPVSWSNSTGMDTRWSWGRTACRSQTVSAIR